MLSNLYLIIDCILRDKRSFHFINSQGCVYARGLSCERFVIMCSLHLFLSVLIKQIVFFTFLKNVFIFHFYQLMVKEGWKMKVDQSVDFSTLTVLPKVSVMTHCFSGKFFLFLNGGQAAFRRNSIKKKITDFLNSSST